jgi:hypothetical protein
VATLAVPPATGPVEVVLDVPPSKSLHQRALLLAVLGDRGAATDLVARGPVPEDVVRFAAALSGLVGRVVPPVGTVLGAVGDDGALEGGRDRRRLDLGMNGTGLRLAVTAAGLRPLGARTLLTGRPRLRARPHDVLLRALARLGAHARRRPTGALRALGRRWDRHDVAMAADRSSQPASALLLNAPRQGGLALTLVGKGVSRGYLALTEHVLAAFGCPVATRGPVRVVAAGAPRCAVRRGARRVVRGGLVGRGGAHGRLRARARARPGVGAARRGDARRARADGRVRRDGPGGRRGRHGPRAVPGRGRGRPARRAGPRAPRGGARGGGRRRDACRGRAAPARQGGPHQGGVAAGRALGATPRHRRRLSCAAGRPGASSAWRATTIALAFGVLGLRSRGVLRGGRQVDPGFPAVLAAVAGGATGAHGERDRSPPAP